MNPRIKLSNEEIKNLLDIPSLHLPKYTGQILNLANQNAQGTRPKVVGQMSELIKEFSGKTLDEWEDWYLKRHPEAIQAATEKILAMIDNFKEVLEIIDENMVRAWVRDSVIIKTFIGLKFQQAILKKIARTLDKKYRLASVEDEAQGIDGYIGEIPVSIKPISYRSKNSLQEELNGAMIFYEKVKGGLRIDFSALIDQVQS